MKLDDPEKPEFASWDSYRLFSQRVRQDRRYVFAPEVSAFLRTVVATIRRRDVSLRKGMILFRAQRGIEWVATKDDDESEQPMGYGSERMKPRLHRSAEGRANPSGIPMLYLGTSEQTVISEVRPWIGAEVSVAQFELLRELKAIDLSKGHGKTPIGAIKWAHLFGEEEPDAKTKEKAVWIAIDNAFSQPVTISDDTADYVPTQILAELFRDTGYDAIVYKSNFGRKGYNIVLFDVADADAINCAPYQVTGIDLKFNQMGDRWFSRKHLDKAAKNRR
jgi:hypothetical protein